MEDLGFHMGRRNSREVSLKRERTRWKWYIKYNSRSGKEISIFQNSYASSFIITNRRLELHQGICFSQTCSNRCHDLKMINRLDWPSKLIHRITKIQAAQRNKTHQDFRSLTAHIPRSLMSEQSFHQVMARYLEVRELVSHRRKMYFWMILNIWELLASKLANMTKTTNT